MDTKKEFHISEMDDGHLCSLTPTGDYAQFGCIVDHEKPEMCTPLLSIGYPIEQYRRLSVLFREMQQSDRKLGFYFSEVDSEHCAISVILLHDYPTAKTIRDALQGEHERWSDGIESWCALTATVHVTMQREESLRFLQRFLNTNKALLVFLETKDGKPPENTTLEGKNPVMTFEISLTELTLKSFFSE